MNEYNLSTNSNSEQYKQILFTKDQIVNKVHEMASNIVRTYDSKRTVFICILNGGLPFSVMLMQAIESIDPSYNPNLQTIYVSRYAEQRMAGEIQVINDLTKKYKNLTGKDIIILDDLMDEGGTIEFLQKHVSGYGAESVHAYVLVKKDKKATTNNNVTYGFNAPDKWLTGMGMDDARLGVEANRWAPWIALAND